MNKVHGANELQATLSDFRNNGVGRVARSMVGAGISTIRRYQAQAAPRGKTGATRSAIGRRLVSSRKAGFVSAKSGINVGKKAVVSGKASHARFTAGTKPRYRKRIGGKFSWVRHPSPTQLRTGRMPVNPFIEQAARSARSAALAAMEKTGRKALARETARIKRK